MKKELKICALIICFCALLGLAGMFVADNNTRKTGFNDSTPSFSFEIKSNHAELTFFGNTYVIGPGNEN